VTKRLAALIGPHKEAVSQNGPAAAQMQSFMATAKKHVTQQEFEQAVKVLDDLEPLVNRSKILNVNGAMAAGANQAGAASVDSAFVAQDAGAISAVLGGLKTKAASAPAVNAKAQQPKPSRLTYTAVAMLIDNMVYLARPEFLDGPSVPPKLKSTSEPSVDGVLNQAADLVRLMKDPKTLPQARQSWRSVQSRLQTLFTEATTSKLGVDRSALNPAIEAMNRISQEIAEREASAKMNKAMNDMKTPDMSKALAVRELKKLEPTLKGWKDTIARGGPMVGVPELKALSRAIDVYYSASDMSAKVAAFQKAGLLEGNKSLSDIVPLLSHMAVSASSAVTEEGIRAAIKAGQKAAEHSLELRLKALKGVSGVIGLYEMWKGSQKLIDAINKGDWHEIAEGSAEIAFGAIGIAESVDAVLKAPLLEGTVFGPTAGVVAIWAVVDSVLMAADQHKWAKEYKANQAYKRMIADAKKSCPWARRWLLPPS
jgi:hypothetical protein